MVSTVALGSAESTIRQYGAVGVCKDFCETGHAGFVLLLCSCFSFRQQTLMSEVRL